MATRKGPTPKRSDERHGHRTAAELSGVDTSATATGATWPEPDPAWHEIAQDWFRALGTSGQAQYFEPSDVATARYVAEAMSANLTPPEGKSFSSMLFTSVMTASADLLATEGARRRLRVELQRATEPDAEQAAAVTNMAERRARVRKTG